MDIEGGLTRIRLLVESGRYQKRVTKDVSIFSPIQNGHSIKVDGMIYYPFLNIEDQRMIYGAYDFNQAGLFHYLVVMQHDYDYGETETFIWFDKDEGGFDEL